MKNIKQSTIAIVCVSISGCVLSNRSVEPLANGYVEITYTRGYIHSAHRITLQYRDRRGRQFMIWPDNGAAHIKGDVAVFQGWKAYAEPKPGDIGWPLKPDIFAVNAPGPPLDITSEIIAVWSKESRKDYAEALAKASIVSIEEKGDSLEFQFAVFRGENWPNRVVRLSWSQVLEIMRDVKEHGVQRKDPQYGAIYIESEVKADAK